MEELPKLVCLFCTTVRNPPSPTTCPPNRTPSPAATIVKTSLLQPGLPRMVEWPTLPQHHLLPWHLPLALARHYLLPTLAPHPGAIRVGLFAPKLALVPTLPTGPCPTSQCLGAKPLAPVLPQSWDPARARRLPLLWLSFSVAPVFATVWAA